MGKLATLFDATRAALRDPEDTSQVFRIADALSFWTPRLITRRFRRERPALLAAKPSLLDRLSDRAALEALPADSLGRVYLDFLDAEGITADGLVEASRGDGERQPLDATTDMGWAQQRMRDSHDLWHAVTGYEGDLLGETALLAFTFAQTKHAGVGFLAGLGILLSSIPVSDRRVVNRANEVPASGPSERAAVRAFIIDGYRRGRSASWFVAQPWEELLGEPIERVRERLNVTVVPEYETLRPAKAA